MPTADEIISRLYAPGVDSSNRLDCMLLSLLKADASVFWEVFQQIWSCCDDTWPLRRDVLYYLRKHRLSRDCLTAENREFFDALPDPVRLFRGCGRRRSRGISWTTSKSTAETFARGHRGISVPDAVIVETSVAKDAILAVDVSRNEAEVLIDPGLLPKRLTLTPFIRQ